METRTIAIVACALGFIFALAGHVAPFWLMFSQKVNGVVVFTRYFGLWQTCDKVSGSLKCVGIDSYSPVASMFRTIMYINIAAPCLLLVALLAVILASKYKAVRMASSILTGLAGILLVASYITFVVKLLSVEFSWSIHFSFFADILASILAFVACGLLVKITMYSASVTPAKDRVSSQQQMSRDLRHGAWPTRSTQHGTTRNPRFSIPPNDTEMSNMRHQPRIADSPSKKRTDMHKTNLSQRPIVDPLYSYGLDEPDRMVHRDQSPELPHGQPQIRMERLSVPDRRLYHEASGDSFLSEELDLPETPSTSSAGLAARRGRVQDSLNF